MEWLFVSLSFESQNTNLSFGLFNERIYFEKTNLLKKGVQTVMFGQIQSLRFEVYVIPIIFSVIKKDLFAFFNGF